MRRAIELFFKDPTEEPVYDSALNTLYLLRRELHDCLIGQIVAGKDVLSRPTPSRLFATALVVFTGIDLLPEFVTPEKRSQDPGRDVHDALLLDAASERRDGLAIPERAVAFLWTSLQRQQWSQGRLVDLSGESSIKGSESARRRLGQRWQLTDQLKACLDVRATSASHSEASAGPRRACGTIRDGPTARSNLAASTPSFRC